MWFGVSTLAGSAVDRGFGFGVEGLWCRVREGSHLLEGEEDSVGVCHREEVEHLQCSI